MKRILYVVDIFILNTDTVFSAHELTWTQLRDTLDNWEWLSNKFGIIYEVTYDKLLEEVNENAS